MFGLHRYLVTESNRAKVIENEKLNISVHFSDVMDKPIVELSDRKVQEIISENLDGGKGIPYGKPLVAELRFRVWKKKLLVFLLKRFSSYFFKLNQLPVINKSVFNDFSQYQFTINNYIYI